MNFDFPPLDEVPSEFYCIVGRDANDGRWRALVAHGLDLARARKDLETWRSLNESLNLEFDEIRIATIKVGLVFETPTEFIPAIETPPDLGEYGTNGESPTTYQV